VGAGAFFALSSSRAREEKRARKREEKRAQNNERAEREREKRELCSKKFHLFGEITFRFACFAKNRDAKQTKCFVERLLFSHVSLFRDTEISCFVKNACLVA
jgi:hypothetical protein